MLLVTSFLAFYITITNVISYRVCKITIKDKYQPLLLKWNNTHAAIWYPKYYTFSNNQELEVEMKSSDSFYLACPGKNNYIKKGRKYKWDNMVEAVCVNKGMFKVNGRKQLFSSLVCKQPIESTFQYENSLYGYRFIYVKIGFNVNSGNKDIFIPIIELCRDKETYTTYYTKFKMTKMIKAHEKCSRRKWKKSYETIDMKHQYSYKNQRNTFVDILKSAELDETRLKLQSLTRGHLTAKADFVYSSQQHSTFWYMNTAPQWKTFNEGNWEQLEKCIRNYVHDKHLDLDVYTGVHDQMTMKDIDGKHQLVFLDPDTKLMPVPKFFWKIIYDPNSRRGTAFVGLNDPFIESIPNHDDLDKYLCKPIKRKILWLIWEPHDIKKGISYACSIADLQKAVSTVPYLDVIDLLV